MKFEQVDGSIIGGLPTSYLTEPVSLRMGNHKETIQFMVAQKMAEAMILELTWLKKWSLTVCWGRDRKRLVMGPGTPELTERKHSEPQLRSERREGPEHMRVATKSKPREPAILKEYQDLAEVFSKKESDVLPPPIAPHTMQLRSYQGRNCLSLRCIQ